jgi:hypothetical protein
LVAGRSIVKAVTRVMSFLRESPPRLWVALLFAVFATHVGVTVVTIYSQSGSGPSAIFTFLAFASVSALLHYLVFRSLRGTGTSARVIPSIFGVWAGLFWFGQLVWMSIPGVFCAVMLVVASNRRPADAEPVGPVND